MAHLLRVSNIPDMKCFDLHSMGHMAYYEDDQHNASAGFVCQECDSGYTVRILCMSKESDNEVGIYLVLTRMPNRKHFYDRCVNCEHDNIMKRMDDKWWSEGEAEENRNEDAGRTRLYDIGAIRLSQSKGDLPRTSLIKNEDVATFHIIYNDTKITEFELFACDGEVALLEKY